MPGGFLSVGWNPNNSTNISEYVTNAGSIGTTPFVLQQGSWESGPQCITKTSGGRYIVPQWGSGQVNIYAADGTYVDSFTTSGLAPYAVVELANNHLVVTSWDGRLVEFEPSGTTYALVGNFASGFTNPFDADYCAATDRLIFNNYSAKKVYSCSSAGSCSVLADHGLAQGRGLRIQLNRNDCSFFLGYFDGTSAYKIGLFNADGSLSSATWMTMPGGINRTFGIDFVIPPIE